MITIIPRDILLLKELLQKMRTEVEVREHGVGGWTAHLRPNLYRYESGMDGGWECRRPDKCETPEAALEELCTYLSGHVIMRPRIFGHEKLDLTHTVVRVGELQDLEHKVRLTTEAPPKR